MGNIKKLAEMARRQGLEPILHENHPYPLSRRQMVAQGLMAGTGYVVGPSLLSLVSQRALAADCGGDPASATSPVNGMRVLAFEAAGGMNIAGSNFMVWGKGGKDDLLPANALGVLGLPASMATGNIVDTELGIPMHVNSPLLEGIRAATTADCRAKINGFPICVTSMDDSNANPFSLSYYAYKAGALGSLSNVIGTETSAHGARSAAPVESVVASVSATQVRSYEDARNLVSAATLENLLPGRTSAILKAATGLSEQRLKMLQDKELPSQIRDLVDCGYTKSSTAAAGDLSTAVDASKDSGVTSALAAITYTNTRNFTISRDPNNNDNQSTLALSYLLCKGYAGFATKVMGGRDYHNNPRNTTNQRDFEVGFQMGTAFQVAHLTGKSLVEILYTDGGVGCSDPNTPDTGSTATTAGGGQAMFTGDRGEGGTIIVMAYHPAGRPPMANSRQQVNAFNNNGGVDQNYAEGKIVANSVTNAVQCALLNILALHGKLGDAEKVLGQSTPFRDTATHENYVMFGPWPA